MSVTMLALARFTLKGPYRAATVVAILALISAFIGPLTGMTPISLMVALMANIMAVILVGVIILTQGSGLGIKVILAALLILSPAIWLLSTTPEPRLVMLLLQWIPVIFLAQVLRSTNSLPLMLLAGVAIGVVLIALQTVYWSELEAGWFTQMLPESGQQQLTADEIVQHKQFVQLVMLLLVSSMYLMQVLVIFVARWLQARLSETIGFREEYCQLMIGKPAAMVTIVAILAGLLLQYAWLLSFALLMIFTFMFQGIAVLHSWLVAKKQPMVSFVLYYVLLVFTWQITGILTSILGLVDNWVVFKRKSKNSNTVN